MSEALIACRNCAYPYAYPTENGFFECPDCNLTWNPEAETTIADTIKVLDAHGNTLSDGDSVVIVKDLPVKGAPKAIKAGTKVKKIRLVEGDHNIDCKIAGFGAMALKSEFVKKA
ncbi:MAG: zinc ribbon domain-containing protein YjdM [Flavobacteriaceae bacterium]|nr:zinc ribbon domain-containing protein YjdM [Flavobacteriaceae bacterium]